MGFCIGMINRVECVQVNVVCNVPPMAQCVLSTRLRVASDVCVHMYECMRVCQCLDDLRAGTSSVCRSLLLGFPALYLADDEPSRCFCLRTLSN